MSLDADIAIVGAGPVGTLLAILLGKQGKKVTLIERWPTIYDRPRAVTMDHEVARVLATLGIDCDNDPAFEYHEELYHWKNADLEPLELVDWESVAASGWRVTYWFNQPELETRLLGMAEKIPSVQLIRGWQAVALTEDVDGVIVDLQETVEINGENGEKQSLRAQYVVGADGANSFVREELGIKNVDKGYFFDWLILDMVPKTEYVSTPNQWQLCDPKRPTTIVPGGPGRRRWEFMVLPEESSAEMAKPKSAWKLLKPWGMTPGDAAHLMPPFAGAGMCTGLRDAVGLGWRLNAILEGKMHDKVIDSYVSERLHHAKYFVDFSQQLGDIICISDPEKAAIRDRSMMTALAKRDYQPIKVELVPLGAGVWCEGNAAAGELSTQGVVEVDGKRDRFDQAIGQGWMVIGYNANPADVLSAQQRDALQHLDGRMIKIGAPGTKCDAIDCEGTYAKWLASIDATYFILRPDFYVAATAKSAENLRSHFDEVISKLYLKQ